MRDSNSDFEEKKISASWLSRSTKISDLNAELGVFPWIHGFIMKIIKTYKHHGMRQSGKE